MSSQDPATRVYYSGFNDAAYAAIAIMSSSSSFSTTFFICAAAELVLAPTAQGNQCKWCVFQWS